MYLRLEYLIFIGNISNQTLIFYTKWKYQFILPGMDFTVTATNFKIEYSLCKEGYDWNSTSSFHWVSHSEQVVWHFMWSGKYICLVMLSLHLSHTLVEVRTEIQWGGFSLLSTCLWFILRPRFIFGQPQNFICYFYPSACPDIRKPTPIALICHVWLFGQQKETAGGDLQFLSPVWATAVPESL